MKISKYINFIKVLSKDQNVAFSGIIKQSGFALILKILAIVVSYVFFFLIAHYYGANIVGLFALSYSLLQIFSTIGRLGLDTANLKFVSEYSSKNKWRTLRDIYKMSINLLIPINILLSVAIYYSSIFLAVHIFNKPQLVFYIRLTSIGLIPFTLLFIHVESLRGLGKIKEYLLLQQISIYGLSSIMLVVINIKSHFLTIKIATGNFPIIVFYLSIIITSFISYIIWRKSVNDKDTLKIKKKDIGEYFTYRSLLRISIPLLFSSSILLIIGWTDTIMLGIFRTGKEVGIYNVTLKIAMTNSIVLGAVNVILAPKISELWGKHDMKSLSRFIYNSTIISTLFSLPILIVNFFLSRSILNFFGREFQMGSFALKILTFGQFVNVIVGSVGFVLQMTNYQKTHLWITTFSGILNVMMNYLLIPLYGVNGAAIASTISVVIGNFISVIYIKQKLNIKTYFRLNYE